MRSKRKYFVGLDLREAKEPTALAVVERTWRDSEKPERRAQCHEVRHLQRWNAGTSYPAMIAEVIKVIDELPSVRALMINATAVGEPVVNLLRKARPSCRIHGVTITAGNSITAGESGLLIPRKVLISTLQILLQTRRLRVASRLLDAPTLGRELARFQSKAPLSGNDAMSEWREGSHDDLVFAVAVACWQAEREAEEDERPEVSFIPPDIGEEGMIRTPRGHLVSIELPEERGSGAWDPWGHGSRARARAADSTALSRYFRGLFG
jgi:hypothetical protein